MYIFKRKGWGKNSKWDACPILWVETLTNNFWGEGGVSVENWLYFLRLRKAMATVLSNFSPTIAMYFSEIIVSLSRRKFATRLHQYTVRWQNLLTDKLPEYYLQLSRRCCIASARHATHRNLCMRRQCNNLKLHCNRE